MGFATKKRFNNHQSTAPDGGDRPLRKKEGNVVMKRTVLPPCGKMAHIGFVTENLGLGVFYIPLPSRAG